MGDENCGNVLHGNQTVILKHLYAFRSLSVSVTTGLGARCHGIVIIHDLMCNGCRLATPMLSRRQNHGIVAAIHVIALTAIH